MKSFGEKLREAREAKGLTCSQVAEKTRILVQIVEDLEKEDFHRIAAPIYGRGFVRLYAEYVGLDPVELNREFMEIYEGHRAPIVKTRVVPAQHEPPPTHASTEEPAPTVSTANEPQPISDELPPIVRGLDLFETKSKPEPEEPAHEVIPKVDTAPEPSSSASPAISSIYESPYVSSNPYYGNEDKESPAEKFKRGFSSVSHGIVNTVQTIPRSTWRIGVLAVAAIVVIGFMVLGISQLYKMTSGSEVGPIVDVNVAKVETLEVKPTAKEQVKSKAEKKATKSVSTPIKGLKSTGHKIPALYID